MARTKRAIPEHGYLHVMCRGNNRRRVFFGHRDFTLFYRLMGKFKREEKIKIIHYCLMPNHVHMLAGVDALSNVARFMQRLNQTYSLYFRRRNKYVGHLWQGRFKSKVIGNEQYFLQCGKYIELNPVRKGLVQTAEDYEYSSYGCYGLGRKDRALDKQANWLYEGLGADEAARRELYRQMIIEQEAIDELRKQRRKKLKHSEQLNKDSLRICQKDKGQIDVGDEDSYKVGEMTASSLRAAKG